MAEDPAPAPVRIDPSSMWENMCLADELLEECELLAEGLGATGGSRKPAPPRILHGEASAVPSWPELPARVETVPSGSIRLTVWALKSETKSTPSGGGDAGRQLKPRGVPGPASEPALPNSPARVVTVAWGVTFRTV